MQRILLPFGRSLGARTALAYVAAHDELPQKADVYLVNVQPPAIAQQIAQVAMLDMMREMRLAAGQKLLRPARDALQARGIASNTKVLLGTPSQSIVRFAEEQGCTMIVMGTTRTRTIGTLVLGSLAREVFKLATVPVTFVKGTEDGKAAPLDSCEWRALRPVGSSQTLS